MEATDDDELRALLLEFRAKDDSDALTLALVALSRSLCLATSKLIHVLEDTLTTSEADNLSEDELMPIALEVVRSYAMTAANRAQAEPKVTPPPVLG